MKVMMNKAIVLLSGGLDSVAVLGCTKDKYNIELALTFNYGQKSAKEEIAASRKIADYYKIKHKIIKQMATKIARIPSLEEKNAIIGFFFFISFYPSLQRQFQNFFLGELVTHQFTGLCSGFHYHDAVAHS